MFFFCLTACKNDYIEVTNTHQTIVSKELEYFELDIKTNIDNLVLTSVENNEKFEYTLNKTNDGYQLELTIYNPQSFKQLTFLNKNKEYDCEIGNVEVLEMKEIDSEYVSIIIDETDEVYIYNKLNKTIFIDDVNVYGGVFLKDINLSISIKSNEIIRLGNIYTDNDSFVLHIKFSHFDKNFEEIVQIKKDLVNK